MLFYGIERVVERVNTFQTWCLIENRRRQKKAVLTATGAQESRRSTEFQTTSLSI